MCNLDFATVRLEAVSVVEVCLLRSKTGRRAPLSQKMALTVVSLTKVDPTANILSRLRSPGASVQVNYTEVLILMQDEAKFRLA